MDQETKKRLNRWWDTPENKAKTPNARTAGPDDPAGLKAGIVARLVAALVRRKDDAR